MGTAVNFIEMAKEIYEHFFPAQRPFSEMLKDYLNDQPVTFFQCMQLIVLNSGIFI